jgi:medium-chain acyl-[acyl-carrier-protein] hydrolase
MNTATEVVDQETFKKWFPGLQRSGTKLSGDDNKCRLKVVCFANAGNAEDLFTLEGLGERKITSPLLEFCKQNKCEMLSVQLPGRANRRSEPWDEPKIQTVCHELASVIANELVDTDWIIIGHSVGTWVSVNLVQVLKQRFQIREPLHAFLSNFPAPTIEKNVRPWRVGKFLSEDEFKDEARKWDVGEVVFTGIWKIYHPLMRADFSLFDQYENTLAEKAFDFEITAFSGNKDRMISKEMVEKWETMTTGKFNLEIINGANHLFPLEKEFKLEWLERIVHKLKSTAILNNSIIA